MVVYPEEPKIHVTLMVPEIAFDRLKTGEMLLLRDAVKAVVEQEMYVLTGISLDAEISVVRLGKVKDLGKEGTVG